jgi:hypothetical protein
VYLSLKNKHVTTEEINNNPKTILIAPLNWGLGHATRCIPIIRALQGLNHIPIIASDGIALDMLRKEFPYLKRSLPSYQITYAKRCQLQMENSTEYSKNDASDLE